MIRCKSVRPVYHLKNYPKRFTEVNLIWVQVEKKNFSRRADLYISLCFFSLSEHGVISRKETIHNTIRVKAAAAYTVAALHVSRVTAGEEPVLPCNSLQRASEVPCCSLQEPQYYIHMSPRTPRDIIFDKLGIHNSFWTVIIVDTDFTSTVYNTSVCTF